MPDSPSDHRVAHVGDGRADQVDDRVGSLPSDAPLRRPVSPSAAPGKDEPDDPVAGRRRLIGASPKRPVMKQLLAFERRHRFEEPGAGAGLEVENVADPLDLGARDEAGRRRARRAAGATSLRRSFGRLFRLEAACGVVKLLHQPRAGVAAGDRRSDDAPEARRGRAYRFGRWVRVGHLPLTWDGLAKCARRRAAAAGQGGEGRVRRWGRRSRPVRSRTSRTCLTMPLPASKRKLLFVFCSHQRRTAAD